MSEDHPKRGRGRPRGTGKPDQAMLRQIASLLAEDPSLKPTTAIKRSIGTKNPSHIRRLQVKWKSEGSRLLADALRRQEKRRVNAATLSMRGLHPMWTTWGIKPWHEMRALDARKPWHDAIEAGKLSPVMQAAIGMMKPWHGAIEARKLSPVMQAAIDMMKPWHDAIEARKLSPVMKAAIDMMKPWHDAIEARKLSPVMQAAIDALKGSKF
jgi:hypothetical protein